MINFVCDRILEKLDIFTSMSLRQEDFLDDIIAPIYQSVESVLNLNFSTNKIKNLDKELSIEEMVQIDYKAYAQVSEQLLLDTINHKKKFLLNKFSINV